MNYLPNPRFRALLQAVLLMLSCTTRTPDDSGKGHPNIPEKVKALYTYPRTISLGE